MTKRARGMQRGSGFTLLELMVVMAIVAVLATLGAPNFRDLLLNQRLVAAAQAFNAALSLARTEAIRRSASVSVVPSAASNWSAGWTVVTLQDDPQALETLRRFEALPEGVGVDASLGDGFAQGVRYDSNGFSRRAANAAFGGGCLTLKADTGRRASIVMSASGRARVCNPDERGDCGTGACGKSARKNDDG